MSQLFISQSMLKDWEKMCKRQFQYKHFKGYDMDDPDSPFFIGDKTMIRFGNYYEQKIIGLSRGGKVTDLTSAELKSTKGQRLQPQIDKTTEWLNSLDGDIRAVQQKYEVSINTPEGFARLSGHWDIHFQYSNGDRQVQDLKLTEDMEAKFGPFPWGRPEHMDHTQPIHYTIMAKAMYENVIPFIYHVADLSTEMRVKILPIEVTEETEVLHLSRVFQAQTEIEESLELDYFEPSTSYNQCCNCPVRNECDSRVKSPNIEPILLV